MIYINFHKHETFIEFCVNEKIMKLISFKNSKIYDYDEKKNTEKKRVLNSYHQSLDPLSVALLTELSKRWLLSAQNF